MVSGKVHEVPEQACLHPHRYLRILFLQRLSSSFLSFVAKHSSCGGGEYGRQLSSNDRKGTAWNKICHLELLIFLYLLHQFVYTIRILPFIALYA